MSNQRKARKPSSSYKKMRSWYHNTHHLCLPPPSLLERVIRAGYCIQTGLPSVIFARTVRYRWVQVVCFKNKWTLQFNPFLQPTPERTASLPVKAQLWYIHSAFKTSNPTCHKLSLQAFMADSKHMLIREQLHPVSSANGAALLIKSGAYQGT